MVAAPVNLKPAVPDGRRIETLDGMRGIAAIAVVLHHYFARWAPPTFNENLYYHGSALGGFYPLQIGGKFGVLLFFLISGYVIMLTLERTDGIVEFAARRFARLWPAMVFAATYSAIVINLSNAPAAYGMDWWYVKPFEWVSSILFVPPGLLATWLGMNDPSQYNWVEGVYWTLWHEVRFYALVALIFLVSPRQFFHWVWAAVQVASTFMLLSAQSGFFSQYSLSLVLQPNFLCWFTLGLVAHQWSTTHTKPALVIALGASVVALLAQGIVDLSSTPNLASQPLKHLVLYTAIALPFILFLTNSRLLYPLTLRPVIMVGLASYPLYLMHEVVGMVYMHWFYSIGIPAFFAVFLAIFISIGLALLTHRAIELPGKRLILSVSKSPARAIQNRFRFLKF
jgi:peptidoglycan/LPS O-acetylase OafA/YrhL